MPVQVYRTQPFTTTHENRIFDALLEELERVWGNSPTLVILLGNFYCQGTEIDAAVLKPNSIIVIDFKNYGGNIQFDENGPWYADGVEVRGGSTPNPYIQIKNNKTALFERLKNIRFPSRSRPAFAHINGMVIFHQSITFDDGQLPVRLATWFHVVDFDHALERLFQITSRQLNLSHADLLEIVAHLAIPPYMPVGRPAAAISSLQPEDELELPQSLQPTSEQIGEFLESAERILVVTGTLGTGLEQLLPAIVEQAIAQGRSCTVLAPNRRLAAQSPVETDSLYTRIYRTTLRLEQDQFVFDLAPNSDTPNHLYILTDAHLVSDALFESDGLRYGSGQLLNDFLQFVDLEHSQRQIVVLGDLFQINRGKADESALFADRLHALTSIQPRVLGISHLLPNAQSDIFVQNAQFLAKRLRSGMFNQLQIALDPDRCFPAPVEAQEQQQLVQSILSSDPAGIKLIAYSNRAVNQLNQWVRQRILGRGEKLVPGDLVQIHNSFFVADPAGFDRLLYVPNDSFAEIVEVDDQVQPLVQPLRGRDQPIVVPFLRVRVRLLSEDMVVQFLCLENYLYAEKPEIESNVRLALYIAARTRFVQEQRQRGQVVEVETDVERNADHELSAQLAQFLRHDPYLNAARLRFGYALTLHRAQGQQFRTVFVDLNTGQGQTNDAYFRWLYTLFTIVGNRLVLFKLPHITPLSKAVWDDSKGKLENVRVQDWIVFDPQVSTGQAPIAAFPIPEPALRNLYLHLMNLLQPQGIRITTCKHHNYQEVYGFESQSDQTCTLRLHYKSNYRVTKIEMIQSQPPQFAQQVRELLTANVRLETEFQHQLYDWMRGQLRQTNLTIRSIDHHDYQEVYYLSSEQGDLKLQLFYDKGGFVSQIAPISYSQPEVVEVVRRALGF